MTRIRRIRIFQRASKLRWLKVVFLVFAASMLFVPAGLYTLTTKTVRTTIDRPKDTSSDPIEKPQIQKPLTLKDYSTIISNDKDSVVKITGYGCGYEFFGSGFVVAPSLVATNAHVVAGAGSPQVTDSNGSHAAIPVLFDPKLDFAVLRVNGLAGRPLVLNQSSNYAVNWIGSHNGDRDVFLGYPRGGSFKAGLAVVADEYDADMSDIYGSSMSARDIYSITATVIPGNSGGPLVQHNGQVAGIVFGVSPDKKGVGLVIPTTDFYNEVQQAKKLHEPVSTQGCADLSVR